MFVTPMMSKMSMTEQKKMIAIYITDITEYTGCQEILIKKHFGSVENIQRIISK